jgi:hypothetical protein
VLGHFRIGKSIRYDLAEVEATLRERFHVGGQGASASPGRAGCPQPAASKPNAAGKRKNRQDNLSPTIQGVPTAAAAANANTLSCDEHQEPHNDGGLRTPRPTSSRTSGHSSFKSPPAPSTSAATTTQPSA